MGRFCVPWYKVDGVMERRQVAQQKYVQSSHVTHCRKFDWNFGDTVRVKYPRSTSLSKFSSGKKIVQVGNSAVKLDDGKWWNKDKISLTKSVVAEYVKDGDGDSERVERSKAQSPEATVQSPDATGIVRFSKSIVKPPKKFDDYIMCSGNHTSKKVNSPMRPCRRSSRTVKRPKMFNDYTC
ncbi:hypothetical protein NDU88_001089 [Pleurodeles waltl]|uniref:Uncharacterized protein n=1 Tax=Pleurodeles waltl TaxID=8319 RepID=A0AAV7U6X0_PLEWA|nr:hypothetical protein NDU88_001089 [Pleurodeles waltl]